MDDFLLYLEYIQDPKNISKDSDCCEMCDFLRYLYISDVNNLGKVWDCCEMCDFLLSLYIQDAEN